MDKAKILIISWGLPPEPIAMAIVVENIAGQFNGDQMVIAGEKISSLKYSEWKGVNNIEINYIFKKFGYRKILSLVQLPFALFKTLSIIKRHKVEKIFAIYPTEVFLLVAYLASLITGKELYLYFVNTYVENRHSFLRPLHILFQKMLFKRSKHVFVMSEGMVDLYRKNYPDLKKCSALRHTFNEEITEFKGYDIGEHVNFYFSGNVNDSCREAATRLLNTISSNPNYTITVSPGSQKSSLISYGIKTDKLNLISVSRDNLISEMRKADIMLLPHGFHGALSQEEYDTIFPTKVIEYMISGKVILLHASETSFLTRFMQEHNCALIVTRPDEKIILEAIETLKNDPLLREQLIRNALKAAELFYAPAVIHEFRETLNLNL
jgi:glycosyltransferase involved in cell wall biosynthesis